MSRKLLHFWYLVLLLELELELEVEVKLKYKGHRPCRRPLPVVDG